MAKIGGLGKGLGALLPNAGLKGNINPGTKTTLNNNEEKGTGKPKEIPLSEIVANPHQPRTNFDDDALAELTSSVKQYGVLQPVILRKTAKGYELIAGERRYRAAGLAGLKTIPAIFRDYSDVEMTEVALIENIQRENLNPVEEAKAYNHLLVDYGMTQDMVSKKVGRSRSHIANFLRLLKLTAPVLAMLTEGKLSMGQAKPLIGLEDEGVQLKAAEFIIDNELSARKAEALVKQLQKNPHLMDEEAVQEPESESREATSEELFLVETQDRLKLALGAEVRIKAVGKKKRIEIEVEDSSEMERLLAMLMGIKSNVGQGDTQSKLDALRQFSSSISGNK